MGKKDDSVLFEDSKDEKLIEKIMDFYTTNSISCMKIKTDGLAINIDKNTAKGKGVYSNLGEIEVDQELLLGEKTAEIKSPMVGIFYSASEPGKDDYVLVGDSIKNGDIVGVLEAMKSFNELRTKQGGTVKEIYVSNGQMVEHGQPLMSLTITDEGNI